MNIKQTISRNLLNFSGWRTTRKIVVIESDDWGSIRMPSRKVFQILSANGIPVEKSSYCKFDCLESNLDLEILPQGQDMYVQKIENLHKIECLPKISGFATQELQYS